MKNFGSKKAKGGEEDFWITLYIVPSKTNKKPKRKKYKFQQRTKQKKKRTKKT